MDKLITALNNNYINNKLKKLNKYEIKYEDISYQEGIFEILEKEKIDIILLSEILSGPYSIKDLINKIKEANNKIEIIIILEKKNEELEKFLKEKNINNYFYNNQLSFDDFNNLNLISEKINNNIDEIKNNILKKKNNIKINIKNKLLNNNIINKIIDIKINIKKKFENYFKFNNKEKYVFSFFGKDSFIRVLYIYIFSLVLVRRNRKVLIVDFDILNNELNTLFGVDKFKNKNDFKLDNVENIFKNLDYYSFASEIITDEYDNIIKKLSNLKDNYDYVFINLSNITNLKLTKRILKITDSNLCISCHREEDIRFNVNLFKIYTNEWGISKDRFKILFNSEYHTLYDFKNCYGLKGKRIEMWYYTLLKDIKKKTRLAK